MGHNWIAHGCKSEVADEMPSTHGEMHRGGCWKCRERPVMKGSFWNYEMWVLVGACHSWGGLSQCCSKNIYGWTKNEGRGSLMRTRQALRLEGEPLCGACTTLFLGWKPKVHTHTHPFDTTKVVVLASRFWLILNYVTVDWWPSSSSTLQN